VELNRLTTRLPRKLEKKEGDRENKIMRKKVEESLVGGSAYVVRLYSSVVIRTYKDDAYKRTGCGLTAAELSIRMTGMKRVHQNHIKGSYYRYGRLAKRGAREKKCALENSTLPQT